MSSRNQDTPISRRNALRTGGLAALGVGLLGAAGSITASVVASAPTIEDAEALLVELAGIIVHLNERDSSNIGHVLDELGQAAGSSTQHRAQAVTDALDDIGPGNRVHDRMDRDSVAARRAFVTHAGVVVAYAAVYHAGGLDAGTAIRDELYEAYGVELGAAIAGAAFSLHLHAKYDHEGDLAACDACWA